MSHPNPARLQDRLDGALPAGESRALDAHLSGCSACARDFAGLKAAAAAFAAVPVPRLTRAFNRKVLAALRPAPYAAWAAGAAGALCAAWTAGVAWAVAVYGRPSWAGLAAVGETALSAAAKAALIAAKLPLARSAGLLLTDAVSVLPSLLAASVLAAAVILVLGRPTAAARRKP
ncbi:MAG: zf-HC2 domain-containing protein [Elusimicrobiota bacterium]|nr:zf-HC2 domain-containing protein [Elusimicrobiota bacterium]